MLGGEGRRHYSRGRNHGYLATALFNLLLSLEYAQHVYACAASVRLWIAARHVQFHHLISLNNIKLTIGSSDYMVTQWSIFKCSSYTKSN